MSGFTSGMRSSLTPEWSTPRDLFDELDEEFHFDLDTASTHENALCDRHYTIEEDGLVQPWEGNVWCNPPYGRKIGEWVKKGALSNLGGGNCNARPSQNRYGMVARVGGRPRDGDQVRTRSPKVRRIAEQRTVPVGDRHIRQAA